MSDYSSELPIRSQLPGQALPDDVIVKLGDATNPTTQLARVDTHGSQYIVNADSAGNLIGDQLLATTYWLQVVQPANGPAAPGTASAYSVLAGGIYNSGGETLTTGQQSALQLTSTGALIVSATLPYDTNYGTVGAETLRTAAQIGNATGAADFGAGATDAQTLRVVANQGAPNTVGNAWPTEITNGTNTASVNASGQLSTTNTSLGSPTGGTAGTQSALAGGIYDSTPPTLTNGQQSALQLDANGRLLVDAAVVFPYDENWGTVGATTLRTAAEIGNATGAADFNWGTVGAQTLRVAAEVGNAAGAADFGAGATDAQTLRTVANQGAPNTAANAWPITITAGGNPNSSTNPVYVSVDTVPGTTVDDFKQAVAIAINASDNHLYTVPAGKSFYFDQVIAAASGLAKMLIAVETGVATNVFTTICVQFNSTADASMDVTFASPIVVATGVRVEVTMTNLDKGAQDLYSTICGYVQ
jgi:hypothetical protein